MNNESTIEILTENLSIDSRCCEIMGNGIMGNGISVGEIDFIDFDKILQDFQI